MGIIGHILLGLNDPGIIDNNRLESETKYLKYVEKLSAFDVKFYLTSSVFNWVVKFTIGLQNVILFPHHTGVTVDVSSNVSWSYNLGVLA